MCTTVESSKTLKRPMIAYAVRKKTINNTYRSPYMSRLSSYILREEISALPKRIKVCDQIEEGFFHMFLTAKDAGKARRKMLPYLYAFPDGRRKYKIVKIKIPSKQTVYFGPISDHCQNAGMQTVCAKKIIHLEEVSQNYKGK